MVRIMRSLYQICQKNLIILAFLIIYICNFEYVSNACQYKSSRGSLCYIITDMKHNLDADKSNVQEIEDVRRNGNKRERIQSNAHMSIFLMHFVT